MVTRWGGLATILKDGVGARIPPIIALSEVDALDEMKMILRWSVEWLEEHNNVIYVQSMKTNKDFMTKLWCNSLSFTW